MPDPKHLSPFLDWPDDLAKVTLVVEVRNLNNLEKLLKILGKIRGVQTIDRFQLGSGPG